MRAVSIQKFGDPSGLAVIDAPEPKPAAGQVLVEVEAIGVGGVDAVVRRGTLGSYGFREGLVPGSEVAGRVVAVGEGVDAAWIGRVVWAFTGVGGAYAEYAVADAFTALPEGLSPVDAVTLGGAGPVAHFALAHGHFAPGESLLVRGAAGSLGIMAVQLAAATAGRIAVTTSSPARGERLRELGATEVLDRSAAAADEFDVILDIVAGPGLPSFLDKLADNGRLVAVGVVGGYPPEDFGMRLLASFQRSRSFATFSLNTVPESARHTVREAQFPAAVRGELRPVVHGILPLTKAAEAHRRMDEGEVFGRFVLTPQ
ncbi:zinc-binding dehydrogenase [Paractinoplanes lichenicola]|uniref:Zinc-binding dehydrogenase n=1 Tax=Paractinoplanes lichenicola TaxID=2802976 RepID=A0ABS1VGS6_9ACTN|nr:zinc-binding dehydrogenase [Actinoplanes lichenicola]MBL7253912.1 zinc-binding dehydrogenase [Actinoplanes lichenicola]